MSAPTWPDAWLTADEARAARGERTRAYDTPQQMHAAADPNGAEVWCDFAEQNAWTNDGFCQFCGSRDHAAKGALTLRQAVETINAHADGLAP